MTKRSTPFDLAAGLTLACMHTGITLWHRWPMLAAARTPQGKSMHADELDRMVREKASAAVQGAFDAQQEVVRLAGAAMTGRLAFAAMPAAMTSLALTGLRPAFRTVKANSRRLSRRRRQKR